jgi:hypothetical protein
VRRKRKDTIENELKKETNGKNDKSSISAGTVDEMLDPNQVSIESSTRPREQDLKWAKQTLTNIEKAKATTLFVPEEVDLVAESEIQESGVGQEGMQKDSVITAETSFIDSTAVEVETSVIDTPEVEVERAVADTSAVEDQISKEGIDLELMEENKVVDSDDLILDSRKKDTSDDEVNAKDTIDTDSTIQDTKGDTLIQEEDKGKEEKVSNVSGIISLPKGEKWAVSSPDVDLSGKWKIIVSDEFKKDYDLYLTNLGQPSLVRSIAVSIVDMTTEEVIQSDNGRALSIKGKNLRGVWDRTLLASGSDLDVEHRENDVHMKIPLVTADKENVEAEAWWENNGTVHRSWLRGIKKYGGGDFESRRYLIDGGKKLVCESEFHPQARDKENAVITWIFERIE